MVNNQTVSFTNKYSEEQDEIERKRKLADALVLQSQQAPELPQQTGMFTPRLSPWAGVSKIVQALSGAMQQDDAKKRQTALQDKYNTDLQSTLTAANQAQTGTPERPAPPDEQGGGPGAPAVAPSRQALIQAFMGHPATQPMAMQQIGQDMSQQQLAATLASAGYGPAGAPAAPGAPPAGGGTQVAGPAQPIAGAPAAGGRGIPPGVDPLAWALMVQKGDTAGLAKMVQEAADKQNAPVVNRGFGIGRMVNGKYVPDQASIDQALAMETGKQGITAPMESPITLKTSSGQEVQLSRPEWAAYQKTGQLPARMTGQAPQAPAGDVQRTTAPTEAAALDQFKEGGGAPRTVSVNPAAAALGTPGVSQSQPDAIKESADKTYAIEAAKGYAKRAQEIRDGWTDAQAKRVMLDRLEGLFQDPNVAKGALAENVSDLKNVAASLGIDVKGLPAEQAIQSVVNEFALQLRNPAGGAGMPGAMSDSDRKFLASMPPGLAKTPQGRALIIETMRKKTQRDQEIAEMALQYEQKNGRLDGGFEKEMRAFAKANPLFAQQTGAPVVSRETQKLLDQYAPVTK